MMKKITFLFSFLMLGGIFLLTSNKADAQVAYEIPRTTFGIKAGPNFSNMTLKGDDDIPDTKMILGLQGGFYANIPIAPQFYIQPSLMYEGKGMKMEEKTEIAGNTVEVKNTMNLGYLTLPVDILFKPEMPNGSGSWIIGVGPYVAYGIVGKNKAELHGNVDGENTSVSMDMDPFKHSEYTDGDATGKAKLNRLDAGANIQLGYEMANGFNIILNGNLGLLNIVNKDGADNDEDSSAKNTSFGITLGYTF